MENYRGMRWLKCDLQTQTPEDNVHWLDADLRLGEPRRPIVAGIPDESGIQEKARRYLVRCHETGLEAIAITDHNFSQKTEPRDWFLTHLVEQNRAVARDLKRPPIVIFPGFEVDIGYHVLCLFAPAKKLSHVRRVNMILTKLGLSEHDRFRSGVPQPLRYNNQCVSLKTLLEIVQGEHKGIVIAAHADQKDGIFENTRNMEDFKLTDLLCVELTQYPPCRSIENYISGQNCDWSRRDRKPAVIQSSDAKSLQTQEDGSPAANALGYRHSWIKMSLPSIESLRQAFLDHESRIWLAGEDTFSDINPGMRHQHARIVSLEISGAAFTADQSIQFSPNLNCIIGGRGSGKSTLLEYLRLALGQGMTAELADDERTRQKIDRVRNTLSGPTAEVRVRWMNRDGVKDLLVLDARGVRVADREVLDPDTFFRSIRARFFSQQQLTQLTEKDRNNLLPLIDDFIRSKLEDLASQERELRAEIKRLFQLRRSQVVIQSEHNRLTQEVIELERQRTSRASLQGAAVRHANLKAENTLINRVRIDWSHPEEWVRAVEAFVESHVRIDSLAVSWPHGSWLSVLDDGVAQAKRSLSDGIKGVVANYQQELNSLFQDSGWATVKDEIDRADAEFLSTCAAQGLSPEEVSRIQEIDHTLRDKKTQILLKEQKLQELSSELASLEDKYKELLQVWRRQFQLRQEAAEIANNITVMLHQKFLDVTVRYAQDRRSFEAIWNRLVPRDGRTSLAKQWSTIGDALFRYSQELDADSPWVALEQVMSEPNSAPSELLDNIAALSDHLHSPDVSQLWEEVHLTRVPDLIDLALFRGDGTCAGSVQEGSLSDGQRNTAVLALLLTQGTSPLIIDQPEDELDSCFIYRDLVPMLRGIKNRRQVIFATHNANLPVNGDSELVYALETKEGRGYRLSEGGLDQSEVSGAVLEVMEGSKEAFQKRREKYHF